MRHATVTSGSIIDAFVAHAFVATCVVGALVLPTTAVAQTREGKKLQLEQFFDIESVSNPRISPDGTQIVYTRGWVDKVNDRRSSALWIMNADGSKSRVPHQWLERHLVARRHADRVHARRRADRIADLGAVDGRGRGDDADHASRRRTRRTWCGRRTASPSRSRCWCRSAIPGRSGCRRGRKARNGPRRRASSRA